MQQVHYHAFWVLLQVVLVDDNVAVLGLERRCAWRVDLEVISEVVVLDLEPG